MQTSSLNNDEAPFNKTSSATQNKQNQLYSRVLKSFPSKKQAILLPAANDDTALIEYIVGIGRLIGPTKIISASKISKNRICIYLDSEKTVEDFMNTHAGITINNKRIDARKLVAPSKKLILSNVHSCIPNSLILEALHAKSIKTTSAIHDLHVGLSSTTIPETELAQYTHVSSFRRGVYVIENTDVPIPESLLIKFENEMYRIFVNDSEQRCYLCKTKGHNSSQCPEYEETHDPTNSTSKQAVSVKSSSPFEDRLAISRHIRDTTSDKSILTNPTPTKSVELLHMKQMQTNSSTDVQEPSVLRTNPSSEQALERSKESMTTVVSSKNTDQQDSLQDSVKRPMQSSASTISSSTGKIKRKRKKKEQTSKDLEPPLSNDILISIKNFFQTSELAAPSGMTYEDLIELINEIRTTKTKNADSLMSRYSQNTPALLNLLASLKSVINHRSISTRLNLIIKHFGPSLSVSEIDTPTSENADTDTMES